LLPWCLSGGRGMRCFLLLRIHLILLHEFNRKNKSARSWLNA